jgi:hypothetical protein
MQETKTAYVILIKEYLNDEIIDQFYLKDDVYPGTLLFFNKNKAIQEANEWTFTYVDDTNRRLKATVEKDKKENKYA